MIFAKYTKAVSPQQELKNICRVFDYMYYHVMPYLKSLGGTWTLGTETPLTLDTVICNMCALAERAGAIDPDVRLAMRALILNPYARHLMPKEELEAWGRYETARKEDVYYTDRRPDGPMAFEGDWSGVFVRGDSCMGMEFDIQEAMSILSAFEGVEGGEYPITLDPETKVAEKDRRRIWTVRRCLENLSSLISGANHHANAHSRQNMKPFEECVQGEYFEQVPFLTAAKPYRGEGEVTSWQDYLGITYNTATKTWEKKHEAEEKVEND